MNKVDINIHHYNLEDILHLFNLSYNYNDNDIEQCRNKVLKTHPYHSNLKPQIFDFYNKAYKIIDCLHFFRNKKMMKNSTYIPNESDDNDFVEKIKKIQDFEKEVQNEELIEKIYGDKQEKLYQLIKEKKLQDEPQKPFYTNIYDNSVVKSDINPIKRITTKQNLHINSCFRASYYSTMSTDFQYVFPTEIKNIVSLRLASIEIPKSWYEFSSYNKNNVFHVSIHTFTSETKTYEIELCDGNYTPYAVVEYLNKKYFYESSDQTEGLKNIKMIYYPNSNKIEFEIIENENTLFEYTFKFNYNEENVMNNFGWIMGFRLPLYEDITKELIGEGVFDNCIYNYIYVSINDYQYNVNDGNTVFFEDSLMNENIIAKIPLNSEKCCYILENTDSCLSKTRTYNGPINLSKIKFSLLDKYGEIIHLNYMDVGFTLEAEILYERNHIR